MTTSKTIDRKTFLTSSVATLASVALGCSDSGGSGGNSAGSTMGSTSAGGTGTGPTTGGSTTMDSTSSAGGASAGGTSGTGAGGTAGTGGTMYMCTTDTNNGDHSHPLTIPGEDVDYGYSPDPYTLEDGGTGHTHEVTLSAYDFLFLKGGSTVNLESTETEGHTHPVVIMCTSS